MEGTESATIQVNKRDNVVMKEIGEKIIDMVEDSPLLADDLEVLFSTILIAFRSIENQVKAKMNRHDRQELLKTYYQLAKELEEDL
jgi:hypothetical protein